MSLEYHHLVCMRKNVQRRDSYWQQTRNKTNNDFLLKYSTTEQVQTRLLCQQLSCTTSKTIKQHTPYNSHQTEYLRSLFVNNSEIILAFIPIQDIRKKLKYC